MFQVRVAEWHTRLFQKQDFESSNLSPNTICVYVRVVRMRSATPHTTVQFRLDAPSNEIICPCILMAKIGRYERSDIGSNPIRDSNICPCSLNG